MATKPRKPLSERLKLGLQEALAHAKGELTLKTTVLPEAPPEIDAPTLVAMREDALMSQAVFARVLAVSAKTVQSWEQGTRVPSQAARRLIHVFASKPDALCEVVGIPSVDPFGFTILSTGGKRRIVQTVPRVASE